MRAARRGAGEAVLTLLARGSALVLAVALTGCGVPGSGSERLPPSEVPSELLQPAPARGPAGGGEPERTAGTGATAALLAARSPSIYLLDDEDVLVAVPLGSTRSTDPAQAPPGAAPLDDDEATVLATRLLRSLASPTADQRDRGLSTALSLGVPAWLVDVDGGTARVALRQPDRDPPADRLPLATGQVVLTVTSVPGITHVRLLRDGEPTAVILPSGALSDAPVTALDYASLLAPP